MRAVLIVGAAAAALALWPRRASAFPFSIPFAPNSTKPGPSMSNLFALIEREEGRVPYVYRDTAGIETFGVGHKLTASARDQGLRRYTKASPAPASVVDAILAEDARAAVAAVDRLRPPVPLSASQRAALASLAFNIGVGAFASSTVARQVNAGNVQAAADAIRLWNKHKDPKSGALKVSAPLAARRERERSEFLA